MLGLTQNEPINLVSVLEHAARWHGTQEVVTRRVEDGQIHRQNYQQTLVRTKKLANALRRLGVGRGDRVASIAWNTNRHVELWYATSGTGSVCHTVNPRLFPEQIEFIMNDAADKILFLDVDLLPVIIPLLDKLPALEAVVVMTERAHMPTDLPRSATWHCYEELLDAESDETAWVQLETDAEASSLCYTSGTTGNPKGVLYSHRGNIFHALATVQKDAMNLGSGDSAMMVVPMFHANSWGLVFSLPMVGAKMVLPGARLDGESIYEMLEAEKVTISAAVPTVWTMLLGHLKSTGAKFSTLKEVVIGGSAVPRSMIDAFQTSYGVHVIHAWGMTEMSPLGTLNRAVGSQPPLTDWEQELDRRCSQGRVPYGVDMKILDDNGNELPCDGESVGRLYVRGPWIVERYFGFDQSALEDGWFDTGDVATISADGFMTITDRAKDIIKSGGEWISSVDIENAAMGHPDVEIAACIGISHPKWEESPLLLVKPVDGKPFDAEAVRMKLSEHIAKWQMPHQILEVEDIPLTGTGKIDKKPLKEQFSDFYGTGDD